MTLPETPGGPVDPTHRNADVAGCAWWWWAIAVLITILILWWIYAWTQPAYRTPTPTAPPAEATLLPVEPAESDRKWILTVASSPRQPLQENRSINAVGVIRSLPDRTNARQTGGRRSWTPPQGTQAARTREHQNII